MSTNNRVEPERCYVKFTSNTEKFPTGWRGIQLQELIQREKGNDHSEKNGGKQVRYPDFFIPNQDNTHAEDQDVSNQGQIHQSGVSHQGFDQWFQVRS